MSSLVTFLGGSGIVATAAGDGLNLDVNAIVGSGTVLADADLIPIYDNSTLATIKVPATALSNYVMAAGGSDGVVSGGGFVYPNLTLTRTVGANVTIPINTDLRIATWARVNGASGTIPDARIPAAIARDTELPSVVGGTNVTVDQSGTVYTVNSSGGGGGGASLSDDTPVAVTPDLSGASGTDSNASRSDHAHAVAAGTAVALGTSHSEGTSTSFARADHVHGSLATVAPDEITPGQTGNVGSGSAVARATHHHSAPVGTPVSVSTANNAGNAASFARSDHIHLGDGTVDSLDATLSGDDLTITVGRTVGNDLTDSVTLPTGSGAITFTRVGVGSVDLTNQIAVPQSFDLSDPIEDGELIEIRISSGTGNARIVLGHFLITGQELLALPAQSGTPASLNGSLAIKTAIQGNTSITTFGHSTVYIWRADTDTLWARNPRQRPVTVEVNELQLTGGGGGGGGSDDGVADSITTSFSGTTLTTTIGRSGTLADLSDTATIPAFDLHDDVTTEHTTILQTDRFLVAAESETGDPNRYATFSTIETTIRPRASDESTLLTEKAAGFNCIGAGITCTVNANNSVSLTVPGGGGGGSDDGIADSLTTSFAGTTLTTTIGRSVGTDLSDTATLPAISALSGTLTATQFADGTIHGGRLFDGTIPTAKYGTTSVTNAKIAGMDASKLTGTIADARIPAAIARDSELPTLPGTVTQAEAEAGTVTATRLWTPQRVSQAIAALAGSGGGDVTGIDAGSMIRVDDGNTATPEVNFDPSSAGSHTTNFNANDRIYLTAFGVNSALRYAPYSQFSTDSRNQIATWARSSNPTGFAPISRGGTGGSNASAARTALDTINANHISTGLLGLARLPAANAIDTELPAAGELVPDGGNNGQILAKASGTDGDTEWIDAPSGGGGSDGIADSLTLAYSGTTLTGTIGRSVGNDLSDTVTIPDGDVTGVQGGSGIGGNVLAGTGTLSFAPAELPVIDDPQAGDWFVISDDSQGGDVGRRVLLSEYATDAAGDGICSDGLEFSVCAEELTTPIGALQSTDEIVMTDASESGSPTVVYTVADLSTFQAGGDLNLDSTSGRLALIAAFRGAYSTLVTYSHGDVVENGDDYWIATDNNVEDSTPSRSNDDWALLTDDAGDVADILAEGTGDGLQSTGGSLQLHVQELDSIGSDYSTEDLFFITNVTGVGTSENRNDTVSDWLDRTAGDGLQRDGTELRVGQGHVVSTMLQSGIGLTGNPTATTQGTTNDSTRIATTAFVHNVHESANSITATQLAADSVGSSEIEAGAVQSSEIANDGIGTEDYGPGSVDTAALANVSVTEAKLADDAVATETIADGAVTTIKIANNAVTSAKIPDNAVGVSEIAANAVRASEIQSGAVGNSELATNSVTTSKIANGDVDSVDLADNAVTQAKIADAAVGVAQLKMASGGFTEMGPETGTQLVNVPRYSFFPRLHGTVNGTDDCTNNNDWIRALDAPVDTARLNYKSSPEAGESCGISWDFMANSDNPGVWVVLNAQGVAKGVWESEEASDTAPVSVPLDDDGVPRLGYTVVNAGLPAYSVIEDLYTDVLTETQEEVAIGCSSDYFMRRGWLSEPWTDIAVAPAVPTRYEPSSRQWMMRCAAKADEKITTLFYLRELVFTEGAWALKGDT